ncbi:hypothetical protein A5893_02845 [Pedobacter psychrophilus]|uniref:Outer membrane protein beta-barrel domain-containing protein n=1 Tax=Pedobacter psychrophilus TaxID=1826909 RepID=A0A179DMD9_9SPHI|nr:hypothetical protein [Pedobacter psychrophilus]OAQ42068.1 hypothetical protein A5893_02845 [Pedobacter psychrophilus]
MKKLVPIILFVFSFSFQSNSQTRTDSASTKLGHNKSLLFGAFYSRNGSGDLDGFAIELGYNYQFKERLSFYNNLVFTIHSQTDPFYNFIAQPTNPIDKTQPLHFVTAGLQTSPTLFYTLFQGKNQKLNIGAGTVIRFQNTGLPEKFAYGYDNDKDIQPSYKIYQIHPTSLSIGYQFALDYIYLSTKKLNYSLKGFYQNDTNSDLIVGIGLTISRKFSIIK